MKAKNMKAEIVKVIRTDTAEGKGTEESPVRSVRRYWTLEDVTNIQVGMNELGNFVECPICGEKIRVTEYTEQIQKRSIK